MRHPDRRSDREARRAARARAEALLGFGGDEPLPHLEGLDGLRGLAVVAVVVFHGGFEVLRGGYLGVSLFFTLSGFLITSLLLREVHVENRVDLGAFWRRRARRLLPAAWITLIGVAIAAVALDRVGADLAGDLWASAAQVANWRFWAAGSSYSELFETPSPLLHFWSLAIEEQFYLLYPVLFVGLSLLCRHRRLPLGLLLAAGAGASFAGPVLRGWSVDRIYYGTDARAGELLVGAVTAVIVSSEGVRRRLVRRWWWRFGLSSASVAALAVTVAAWVTAEQGDRRLGQGLLAVIAGCSSLLILGAVLPGGPLRAAMSARPLRWIGSVSYGIYLFHWPVFVWSGATGSRDHHLLRFAVATAGVVILAGVSYRLIERPIRVRAGWAPIRPLAIAGALVLAVGPFALSPPADPRGLMLDELASAEAAFSLEPDGSAAAVRSATTNRTEALPPISLTVPPVAPGAVTTLPSPIADPPTMSFFGDSIALSLAMTLGYWNADQQHYVDGRGVARLGCGVIPGGSIRWEGSRPMPRECDDWAEAWTSAVRAVGTDVAVVHSCQWETIERRYPGMERFVAPGDPAADATILAGYTAAVDVLLAAGADHVVWVDCPAFSQITGTDELSTGLLASRQPERVERLNGIIDEVARQRQGLVTVMAWSDVVNPRVDDATLRPDGSHYEWKTDVGTGAEFGSRLIALVDALR